MPREGHRKYVSRDTTDGVVRWYFRKRGQQKVRLPDEYGGEDFNRVYEACLNGTYKPDAPEGPKLAAKNSLRWLCEQYFASSDYRLLDQRTAHVRRQILETCWEEPTKPGGDRKTGDMPIAKVTSKVIRMLRDRKTDAPESGNARVKALRQVFNWACSDTVELASTNPARDVPYFKTGSDGFHTWTIDEVEQFEARHPVGTKARLALALLLYTLQRKSDIIQFGKQHVRNGVLRFTQHKGRKKKPVTLELPLHPKLISIIEASPCGDLHYLVTEFKKPFTANGFGNWFRKRCDEAFLYHCSAHGLRKAGSTRMAERGASEHQIMSFTGHQTSKEVTRYTRAARQKIIAQSAVEFVGDAADHQDESPPDEG